MALISGGDILMKLKEVKKFWNNLLTIYCLLLNHHIAIYRRQYIVTVSCCDLRCGSRPLVVSTLTLQQELPGGLHIKHTHTHALLFRWQYVFYFLDFKGLLFTNKINKKKDQKDFLTNTVCLHIVVRKFTFIFLPSVSSNQLSSFFFLQALGYMNELNNDHVSGVTEDRAAPRRHRRRFRPSPTVFTTHIIGKHMKTVVAKTK